MDVTVNYKLRKIKEARDKKHWKIRKYIWDINVLISNYRYIAYKRLSGTNIGSFCTREANRLERDLAWAVYGIKK